MASKRIPPELYDNILAYVEDEGDPIRYYPYRETRHRTLRYLSPLSSVCLHWANVIRPRMFQILVLRSAQDLYGLLALLRMPCSPRICSIGHCLQKVAVFYQFTDYFWCHNLQRLQASGARKELGLRIHISGPAPCVRNKERTARHPLYNTVPRIVPIHRGLLLQVDLIIEIVKFPDGAGLVNLIRDISYSGILPRSIYCEGVSWDDKLTLPFASLDPTFALNQNPHVKPSDVTIKQCTDNFLVAFATHSYIGRDVSMLSPSDANQLLGLFSEWASLTGKALSTMKYFTITSQAIHDIPVSGRKNLLLKAAQGAEIYC